jgi:hypothetical protein
VAESDIVGSSYEWDLEIASIIYCDDHMLVHELVAEDGRVGSSYKQDLKIAAYAWYSVVILVMNWYWKMAELVVAANKNIEFVYLVLCAILFRLNTSDKDFCFLGCNVI